jgi:hypothetical protein
MESKRPNHRGVKKMLRNVLVGGFIVLMIGAVVAGGIALFVPEESAHAAERQAREGVAVARRGPGGEGGQGGSQGGGRGSQEGNTPGGGFGQGGGRGSQEGSTPTGGFGQSARTGDQEYGCDDYEGDAPEGSYGEGSPGGGYGRGQGQGQGSGPEIQLDGADWQTIEGTVVETEDLVIEMAEGETVQVGLGPSQYREDQGFILNVDDTVRVSGYWENDEFKATQVENLDTGASIVLRDASGRPMWAGQGRGRGQGA